MKIAILIGSATPPGRTHAIAAALAETAGASVPDVAVETIDLASVAFEPCDGRPPEAYDASVRRAVDCIREARGVIVVAPVYRATYPGVLKNFLDILPLEALRDTVVALAVVGGSAHHYLGVDYAVRTVLAWFGAIAAPTSVYFTGSDFDEQKLPRPKALLDLEELVRTLIRLTFALPDDAPFGPAPFAARR